MNKLKYTIAVGSLICFGASAQDQTSEAQQRQQLQEQQQRREQAASPEQKNQQSTFQPREISEDKLTKTVTDINKASAFMGMQVKNLQNEELGKVQDLVFDPKEGKISYVVLSTGGFLGIAGKSVAVPLKSLEAKQGANHLVIDMSKDQLQAAPGLAQNNWPSLDTFAAGGAASAESGSQSATQSPSTSNSDPSGSQDKALQGQSQSQPSPSPTPESSNQSSTSATESNPDGSGAAASSESSTGSNSDSTSSAPATSETESKSETSSSAEYKSQSASPENK